MNPTTPTTTTTYRLSNPYKIVSFEVDMIHGTVNIYEQERNCGVPSEKRKHLNSYLLEMARAIWNNMVTTEGFNPLPTREEQYVNI